MVHPTSPESNTRPSNVHSAGSWNKAAPVTSRGHEAITLPSSQTSATSAIAAFKTAHPAACSDVHIVNSSRLEFLGPPDVVNIIRIASVNQNVAGLEISQSAGDGLVDGCSRDHQPYCTWLLQLAGHIAE